ncbi:hypothetical protein TrST_g1105 [Triparma strigata]|uniref:RING-type E3 ubiquitin transferase n=1 Tax=Triparma strigata TaxID=1606541 RepID=A0A9W7AK52_9STRA|nr:hypothetical protein TrST_g1105 [Triparma strigata]
MSSFIPPPSPPPTLEGQENSSVVSNSRSCTPTPVPTNLKNLQESQPVVHTTPLLAPAVATVQTAEAERIEERRKRIGLNSQNDESDVQSSEEEEEEETEEERSNRELLESEALARQLMAEEALLSYQVAGSYLRDNADAFDPADLAALEQAMREEDPEAEGDIEEEESAEMDYDQLLELGDRLGDVKTDRWKLRYQSVISTFPLHKFSLKSLKPSPDDSELKCLICQCEYEENEELIRLPCGHVFHKDCGVEWAGRSDLCAYCRTSVEEVKK